MPPKPQKGKNATAPAIEKPTWAPKFEEFCANIHDNLTIDHFYLCELANKGNFTNDTLDPLIEEGTGDCFTQAKWFVKLLLSLKGSLDAFKGIVQLFTSDLHWICYLEKAFVIQGTLEPIPNNNNESPSATFAVRVDFGEHSYFVDISRGKAVFYLHDDKVMAVKDSEYFPYWDNGNSALTLVNPTSSKCMKSCFKSQSLDPIEEAKHLQDMTNYYKRPNELKCTFKSFEFSLTQGGTATTPEDVKKRFDEAFTKVLPQAATKLFPHVATVAEKYGYN
jgi:hypothetical protein